MIRDLDNMNVNINGSLNNNTDGVNDINSLQDC